MKTQLEFKDSKILIVCPSTSWNSIERRAIKDAIFLKKKGSIPYILCIKGSEVDSYAKEHRLKTIYYQGKNLTKVIDFKYYLELKKILESRSFNFVHCFNARYIWMLCFAMRAHKHIPLFLSLNKRVSFSFKNFFYKWLLSRVDRVFTFSQTMIDIVPTFLDIPKRKVKFSGFGLMASKQNSILDNETTIVSIITTDNILKLENLINQIFKTIKKNKLKMILYYDRSVEIADQVHRIKDIIISLQVGEYIGLRKLETEDDTFGPNRIFISTFNNEAITDYEVSALMRSTLVLTTRSLARSNLGRIFYGALQSYKINDNLGLRRSLNYLIKNKTRLRQSLDEQSQEANFYHGEENYFELLGMNFLKINKLRFRYQKNLKTP